MAQVSAFMDGLGCGLKVKSLVQLAKLTRTIGVAGGHDFEAGMKAALDLRIKDSMKD